MLKENSRNDQYDLNTIFKLNSIGTIAKQLIVVSLKIQFLLIL